VGSGDGFGSGCVATGIGTGGNATDGSAGVAGFATATGFGGGATGNRAGAAGFTISARAGETGRSGTRTGHATSGSTTIGGSSGGCPFTHVADFGGGNGTDGTAGGVAAAGSPV
jgi:hypothetical protein